MDYILVPSLYCSIALFLYVFGLQELLTVVIEHSFLFLVVFTLCKYKKSIEQFFTSCLLSTGNRLLESTNVLEIINYVTLLTGKSTQSIVQKIKGKYMIIIVDGCELRIPYDRSSRKKKEIKLYKDGAVVETYTHPKCIPILVSEKDLECDSME